jgi:hypothetical protein
MSAATTHDRHPSPTRTLSAPLRAAALTIAATAVDVAVDPTRTHIPLCPFHAVTGWWCPLCGSLRAVGELVRGHPATALHDNVLLVLAIPVVFGLWWAWVVRTRSGTSAPRWNRSTVIGVVVVLVAFTVVRNLPAATALRP